MAYYRSVYSIGDTVNLDGIHAVVSGVWFEGSYENPNIQLRWFHNGDNKETWIRQEILKEIIAGTL